MLWVESAGGPLLFVSRDLAGSWRGVETRPGGPTSDYDLACGVSEPLGTVAVGAGQALVLGDEPLPTAFVPAPGGGTLVRWVHAPDEAAALRALEGFDGGWTSSGHSVRVGPGGAVLFDAACPGDRIPGVSAAQEAVPAAATVPLAAGTYRVDTADHRPDAGVWLVLHRLTRTGR